MTEAEEPVKRVRAMTARSSLMTSARFRYVSVGVVSDVNAEVSRSPG